MKHIQNAIQAHWRTLIKLIAFIALLFCLFFQMHASSAQKSAAFDETYHLVSGYAYLHTGSPRLSWEHPPVPQTLAALPLIARDDIADFPTHHPGWQEGNAEAFVDDYLWRDNHAIAADLVWAGRVPLMWLTVGFGLALFAALYTLVGEPAAWVGLTLFALDPNIIANGRIIGNDLAVAGFMLISSWRLGMYLRKPTAPNLILTGIAVGLAVASKLTAVLVGPAFALIVLVYPEWRIANNESNPPSSLSLQPSSFVLRRFGALILMACVTAITIWAVFGFEIGPLTEGGIPVPAPTYLRGLPRMFQRVARGTPTFLMGQVSDNGWWYYFAVTFLLKTPLPTLILLGIGAVHALRNWRETVLWWGPLALYFIVASGSTLQIGYRYILPVLVFSITLAASPFREWPKSWTLRGGLVLLGLWLIVDAASVYPDYLAYSNQLAGGPDHTWQYFADMNVDWGMDLPALHDYANAHPDEHINLAYFGSAYPSAYNIHARLLPSFSRMLSGPEYAGFNPYTPEPGTYCISVTSLHLGLLYEGQDLYAYFREREPDAQAGRSIRIYRVEADAEASVQRAVVVGPAVWRQSPEILGVSNNSTLITKWTGNGAIVLPANGPARFIVQANVPDTSLVAEAIKQGDARALLDTLPVFAPPTTPDHHIITLPASFENGPSLAGWDIATHTFAPGETIRLFTYWRITEPYLPSLATFIHLIDTKTGQTITQWDGWSVSSQGLESGDAIVMEHTMTLPNDALPGEYPLQIGLYLPPNGPRLPVANTDRLYLTTVDIVTP